MDGTVAVQPGGNYKSTKVLLFMLTLDRAGCQGFINPKHTRPDEEALQRNVDKLCTLVLKQLP